MRRWIAVEEATRNSGIGIHDAWEDWPEGVEDWPRKKKITIADMLLKNPDPTEEAAVEMPREGLNEYVTVMVMDFQ